MKKKKAAALAAAAESRVRPWSYRIASRSSRSKARSLRVDRRSRNARDAARARARDIGCVVDVIFVGDPASAAVETKAT